MLANNIGKSIDDLKWGYTIDQLYLLYEKCKKKEMEDTKVTAITLAQALIFTSQSESKSRANKKKKAWNNFIDSLSIESKKDLKVKKSKKEIKNVFAMLGRALSDSNTKVRIPVIKE